MDGRAILDVERLAAHLAELPAVRPVVGIDGPGGSGKSTLAQHLAERLPGCSVVHGDDLFLPSAVRPERDFAAGGQFDLARLRDQVLAPARAGHAARYQVYDWELDGLAEWEEVPAVGPVLVEGVYCTEARLRGLYDVRVYCGADRAVRLARALARDGDHMRRLWTEVWMPAEDAYLAGQRPDGHADLVLDGGGAGTEGPLWTILGGPARPAGRRSLTHPGKRSGSQLSGTT